MLQGPQSRASRRSGTRTFSHASALRTIFSWPGLKAIHKVFLGRLHQQANDAIHHGDVDELACAGALAGDNRGQDSDDDVLCAGGIVGEDVAGGDRRIVAIAEHAQSAAVRQVVEVMAGLALAAARL